MAWNNQKMYWEVPMLHPCRPSALDKNVIEQINKAPDYTVRAVLRHLTADYDQRFVIENLISKLPLDESELQIPADKSSKKRKAETQTPEDHNPKKRKATPKLEVCLQCEEVFEEGDTSESCRYHLGMPINPTHLSYRRSPKLHKNVKANQKPWCLAGLLAMFLDPKAPYWETLGPGFFVEDRPINRKVHLRGYWFPCCDRPGIFLKMGCRVGRHRAADGKREKDLYGFKDEDHFRNYMGVPKKEDMASWEAHCIDLRKASMSLEVQSDSAAEESDSNPATERSDSTPVTERSDSTPVTERSDSTPVTEESDPKKATKGPDVYDTNGEDDHGEEEHSWVDEYDKDGQDFPDFMQMPHKKMLAALRAQEIGVREAFATREAFESLLGPLWPSQTLMVEKPSLPRWNLIPVAGSQTVSNESENKDQEQSEDREKRIDQGQAAGSASGETEQGK